MNVHAPVAGIAAPRRSVGARNDTVWVGAFEFATRAMGPGLRACIWVRGCPMRCRGCATPEFLEFPEGHPYRPLPLSSKARSRRKEGRGGDQEGVVREQAASSQTTSPPLTPPLPGYAERGRTNTVSGLCTEIDRAIAEHGITGVSFSGGEPFAQAAVLAAVARHARSCGLSTLSWSGFARAYLEGPRAPGGSAAFLAQLDVLIDGPFVARHARGGPLRGSSNQRIHLLTGRHRLEEFEDSVVEVIIGPDGATVTSGVMEYAAMDPILAMFGVITD